MFVLGHRVFGMQLLIVLHVVPVGAEIVLQIIDAPLGVGLCVLLLMVQAAGVASAGLGSRAGVDAELQSLGMNVVTEGLHVGELCVRVNHTLRIALSLPGVVDVDVDVSCIFHAGAHQLICRRAHVGIGDVACEVVPAIPSHRWKRSRGLCHKRRSEDSGGEEAADNGSNSHRYQRGESRCLTREEGCGRRSAVSYTTAVRVALASRRGARLHVASAFERFHLGTRMVKCRR